MRSTRSYLPLLRNVLILLVMVKAGMLVLHWGAKTTVAAKHRVLPDGKLPADTRLGELIDYNGYFPWTPPSDKQVWAKRAEQLRRQILISQGLWPLPTRTPLNAVVHGKVERDNYTVERVYFESLPGLYVTGNLYRPKGAVDGLRPVVLCPHGHWNEGRFFDSGEAGVKKLIASGDEKYPEGGRSHFQARCVQLARMGCVVFFYDMLGYADSQQFTFEFIHRFAKQRPGMNSRENWGLYSPQAEAHLQNVMGLQTWNSIRALDFVETLKDVDPARIGVTGASGGGTQSFILAAIDPRISVAVPAVMVSTSMQGGCTCENASCLRVATGNVEIAALFAPKPLLMTAANDWTKEMETKGFPQLKEHYSLFGAEGNVSLAPFLQFGHNYNYVSRAPMYEWMNKHLKIGLKSPIVEEDYKRLSIAEMTVWDEQHPKPAGGDDVERKIVRWLTDDARKQLDAIAPRDAKSLGEYRRIVGGAIDALIGRKVPVKAAVSYEQIGKEKKEGYLEITGLVRHQPSRGVSEELPMVFLHPADWNGKAMIWLTPTGKEGLYDADGSLQPAVKKLVDGGTTVIGVDLIGQGEFLADDKPLTQTRVVKNPREFAGYTFGYNPTLFVQRVHDVLTVIGFVENHELKPKQIILAGFGECGPIAAAARAQAGESLDAAVIDTAGFRFANLTDYRHPMFFPGGAKYDDVPGLLSVAAPGKLFLAGETGAGVEFIRKAYSAAGEASALTIHSGKAEAVQDAAAEWSGK